MTHRSTAHNIQVAKLIDHQPKAIAARHAIVLLPRVDTRRNKRIRSDVTHITRVSRVAPKRLQRWTRPSYDTTVEDITNTKNDRE